MTPGERLLLWTFPFTERDTQLLFQREGQDFNNVFQYFHLPRGKMLRSTDEIWQVIIEERREAQSKGQVPFCIPEGPRFKGQVYIT
jgi:hypothetical protein